MESRLSIVIPVYNEGANFPGLWDAIRAQIQVPFQASVIYEFDNDNTLEPAREIINQGEQRLALVKNSAGCGVLGAILTVFNQVKHGPVLVLMADLCDDLSRVPAMLELYKQGNHIVAGSRYMSGGGIENGPFLKQTLSRLGGLSLHWLRGIPTHDATNAFKIYDAEMLSTFNLESRGGFELNLEITVKAFLAGYRIAEIPS